MKCNGSAKRKRLLPAGLLFLLSITGPVFADEVTMKNGDRLTGTVQEAREGELLFKPTYSDAISLRMDQIEAIETDDPVTLRMRGKEVLSGRLSTADGQVRLHASEGREETVVLWERVRSINVPDITWSGNVFAGSVHESGNTDRLSVNLGADATRRGPDDRFSISFLYNYGEEDGELTSRDAYGAVKYDYFFTEKFFGLLSIELLKDKFKDLNLRAAAGPGIGYQVWDEDDMALALEAGVTWFSEDRIEDEDEQWISGRLAAVFRYQLTHWLRFSDSLTIYPNLENLGNYTLRNEATLVTSLGADWSLRVGNIWERDSDPAPEVKRDDLRTSLALQYSF